MAEETPKTAEVSTSPSEQTLTAEEALKSTEVSTSPPEQTSTAAQEEAHNNGLPAPTPPLEQTPKETPISELKTSARVIATETQSAVGKQSDNIKAKFVKTQSKIGKQGDSIKDKVVETVVSALGATKDGVGVYVDKAQDYVQKCHSTTTSNKTPPASASTDADGAKEEAAEHADGEKGI